MFFKETSLPPKHRLLFLQRKLDYLEDFGDSIADVTKAQAEVAKLRVEIKDAESKSYGSDNGQSFESYLLIINYHLFCDNIKSAISNYDLLLDIVNIHATSDDR